MKEKKKTIEKITKILQNMPNVEVMAIYRAICKLKGIASV